MTTIIKLTRVKTNEPVFVNFHNVKYFSEYENGTKIIFNDSSNTNIITVLEDPNEIISKLNLL